MTERERAFTSDELATIRERFHGWEQASASQLAAIFGTTVQRISAIVHSNRPDALEKHCSGGMKGIDYRASISSAHERAASACKLANKS